MQSSAKRSIERHKSGDNLWLRVPDTPIVTGAIDAPFRYTVFETENAVGKAMLDELVQYATEHSGDVNVVLLGGRGAQAMYRLIRQKSEAQEIDQLLSRLNVFTQDALAPMRMNNGLSFVRDFERLLGPVFFKKIKSFTPMQTETDDLEGELAAYVDKLLSLGGIDIFFLGFGPEAEAASHLCYIKPGCGAQLGDFAGAIPISCSILEHHISKFKVGGSEVSAEDENECRRASHILTLGPAAILRAKRIVQSIVDASTAPGKRPSFKRFLETKLENDPQRLVKQTDENPGLLVRLHPEVRSFILPDLLV